MWVEWLLWGMGACVLTMLGTGLVRRQVMARGMLDIPNDRSSHTVPTPRGGGIAIVAVAILGAMLMGLRPGADAGLLMAFVGGGLLVAAVGFLDDRRPVAASLRLLVHVLAALWAVYALGGLPPIQVGEQVHDLGLAGDALGVMGIAWAVNLFNFMDGIDGIAASEASVICLGAALILAVTGVAQPPSADPFGGCILLGAASLGFLWWNWPRARIFMGDVGSGFLGFAIAALALAHAHRDPAAVFIWAILGASFIADSAVTLVTRLLRRQPVHQAHRTHAYQRLTDRWGGHRPVTLAYILVNLFWLLPIAVLASANPSWASSLALIATIPLVITAVFLGAGRAG